MISINLSNENLIESLNDIIYKIRTDIFSKYINLIHTIYDFNNNYSKRGMLFSIKLYDLTYSDFEFHSDDDFYEFSNDIWEQFENDLENENIDLNEAFKFDNHNGSYFTFKPDFNLYEKIIDYDYIFENMQDIEDNEKNFELFFSNLITYVEDYEIGEYDEDISNALISGKYDLVEYYLNNSENDNLLDKQEYVSNLIDCLNDMIPEFNNDYETSKIIINIYNYYKENQKELYNYWLNTIYTD